MRIDSGRLPFWRLPDAVIMSFASNFSRFDPIQLQMRVLGKLWKRLATHVHVDRACAAINDLFKEGNHVQYNVSMGGSSEHRRAMSVCVERKVMSSEHYEFSVLIEEAENQGSG
jgi:hypothetical protein